MDVSTLSHYFAEYGILIIFLVIFLEHLNLPGFPAAIIMPLVGIWVSNSNGSLLMALLISVIAGVLGSSILYVIGRFGGILILDKFTKKFPKHKNKIDKNIEMLQRRGFIGVFISKLIPMIRTISPIPAGAIRINFPSYVVSSALGIAIWNSIFICGGYFFGEKFIFV